MAVMVATGVAAQRGCLVKSAAALEIGAGLQAIVLDKTGTVTQGTPAVRAAACVVGAFEDLTARWREVQGEAVDGSRGKASMQYLDDKPVDPSAAAEASACFWWLLGTLECASDHPLAQCISQFVKEMPGLPEIVPPSEFEYRSGRGMQCEVPALGITARVGNLRFLEESQATAAPGLQGWIAEMQVTGHTVVVLHAAGVALGAVGLQDPIREDAVWAVSEMQRMGAEVWLCTGDNTATAQAIAAEVGIDNVVAEALPSTKGDLVRQLQRQRGGRKRRVCFVGDGINDSPALATADVGVAIGAGAQVAIEAADVVLMRSELADCIGFLALCHLTMRTIALNFFWAFCFNFAMLPMAAGVFYPKVHIPPLAAGMGMAASSCLVVFSSLLIRRFRPPVPASLPSRRLRRGLHAAVPQEEGIAAPQPMAGIFPSLRPGAAGGGRLAARLLRPGGELGRTRGEDQTGLLDEV
mmetsp:Transcript_108578/g.248832  ORF Transcript_108578/g.248832 Transcript_108578/m.248832 type:complete len:468 (+) Transcript_108578:3-1406(+)